MRLFLVRHGDKEPGDWLDPRINHHDNPLSERGRAEALRVAERLADEGIGAIRVSRYSRTSETARPLARRLGLPILVDPRLDEIDVGETDKHPEAELPALFPDFWREYSAFATDFRYPGGERGADVARRIASFLEEAAAGGFVAGGFAAGGGASAVADRGASAVADHGASSSSGAIAAFAHDGLVRITACLVLGLPMHERRRFRAETCGITELEWDSARFRWDIVRMNAKY